MEQEVKKVITLESLSVSVDKVAASVENLAVLTAKGFERVEGRMEKLEARMDKLENEMTGLCSSVNNYLQLSDKRYLELKARQEVIVNWVKLISEKTGVKINLQDLEKLS